MPSITSFSKAKTINGCIAEQEWVTQLYREAVIGITLCTRWRQRTILVTTQTDSLFCIAGRITRHTVTTHIERLKWRLIVLIIVTEYAYLSPRHQHKALLTISKRSEGT